MGMYAKKTWKYTSKGYGRPGGFGNPKGPCFIATATLGDYNHPTVKHLRYLRDTYLINKSWGRTFIKYYYKCSPSLAQIIERSPILKKLSYLLLIKPIFVITKKLLKTF